MSRSRLEVVPFKAEHLIDLIPIGREEARRAVWLERNMKEGGRAWSGLLDGRCVGCGGLYLDADGKYLAWIQVTPELLKLKKDFHKACIRLYRQFRAEIQDGTIKALCDTRIQKTSNGRNASALKLRLW